MSQPSRVNYGTSSQPCQPKPSPTAGLARHVSRHSPHCKSPLDAGLSKPRRLYCTGCGGNVLAVIEFLDPHVIHYAGICPNCYAQECETVIR